jgi:hypothetical protein
MSRQHQHERLLFTIGHILCDLWAVLDGIKMVPRQRPGYPSAKARSSSLSQSRFR